MNMFTFLGSLLRETFSVLRLESEVNPSARDKPRLLVRKAIISLLVLTLIFMTMKAFKLSADFAEYRKMHKAEIEKCESKNNTPASSDSGIGLTTDDKWLHPVGNNYLVICTRGTCLNDY